MKTYSCGTRIILTRFAHESRRPHTRAPDGRPGAHRRAGPLRFVRGGGPNPASILVQELNIHNMESAADESKLSASRHRQQVLAALMGILTAFLMACMALAAKLAVRHGGTAMLNLTARGFVGWLCHVTLLRLRSAPREDYIGPRHVWHLLFLRVVVGSAALALFLGGLPLLPLGDATALFLTNQFWTCLFARIFFDEPLRFGHAVGIVLGAPGALLVVQPPSLGFGDASSEQTVASAASAPAWAALFPLGASVGAAGAYVLIQACGRAGASRSAIVHCFTFGSAILGLASVLINGDWRALLTASNTCLLYLLACGLLGYIAQCCLTAAIGFDSASTVAVAMLSEVAFAFALEAMAFETRASALTLSGALLTTLGVLAATLLPHESPISLCHSCCAGGTQDRARLGQRPSMTKTARRQQGRQSFIGLLPEEMEAEQAPARAVELESETTAA